MLLFVVDAHRLRPGADMALAGRAPCAAQAQGSPQAFHWRSSGLGQFWSSACGKNPGPGRF